MQQKRRILLQSCALRAQRIINARSKYIKGTAAKKKIRSKLYKGFEHIIELEESAISKSAEKQEFAWIVLSFWCKGAILRK